MPFDFSGLCFKSWEQLKQDLVSAPIIFAPDWAQPFEIMCDVSDFAIGAVLGQRIDNRQHVIYYSSRTLNDAQQNYTTTEKEFLAAFFALKKFRRYLLGSKTVIFTDHSALKYLMTKNEAKARLVPWILLLQEFDLKIRNKRGIENVVADHLSRILNAPLIQAPVNEDFPDGHILAIFKEPWYADIVNYLATRKLPVDWTKQDPCHFFAQYGTSSGKSRVFLSIVPTRLFDDAYQRKNRGVCLAFAMNLHATDILVPAKSQRKFTKWV